MYSNSLETLWFKLVIDIEMIEKLYEYLDWYDFVSEEEINMAVCEFIEQNSGEPLSYYDCACATELAEQYIKDSDLHFD